MKKIFFFLFFNGFLILTACQYLIGPVPPEEDSPNITIQGPSLLLKWGGVLIQNGGTYTVNGIENISKSLDFILTNQGTETLLLNSSPPVNLNEGTGSTSLTQPPSSLASGISNTFSLSYAFAASGSYQAVINIPSNDPSRTNLSFTLIFNIDTAITKLTVMQGTTACQNSYDCFDFGSIAINNSSPWISFTLTNEGNTDQDLSYLYLDTSNEYTYDAASVPSILYPGNSAILKVQYTPKNTGTFVAQIEIGYSLFVLQFRGTGY